MGNYRDPDYLLPVKWIDGLHNESKRISHIVCSMQSGHLVFIRWNYHFCIRFDEWRSNVSHIDYHASRIHCHSDIFALER